MRAREIGQAISDCDANALLSNATYEELSEWYDDEVVHPSR